MLASVNIRISNVGLYTFKLILYNRHTLIIQQFLFDCQITLLYILYVDCQQLNNLIKKLYK